MANYIRIGDEVKITIINKSPKELAPEIVDEEVIGTVEWIEVIISSYDRRWKGLFFQQKQRPIFHLKVKDGTTVTRGLSDIVVEKLRSG